MNQRKLKTHLTIPNLSKAGESSKKQFLRSISFSEENSEAFKPNDNEINLAKTSPRINFDDMATPKFNQAVSFEHQSTKDLEDKIIDIQDYCTDEYGEMASHVNVVKQSLSRKVVALDEKKINTREVSLISERLSIFQEEGNTRNFLCGNQGISCHCLII